MAIPLKSALWKVAKGGIIMFTVGVLLALAAPFLADMIGMNAEAVAQVAAHNKPMWLGTFFGAFGALHAAVEPIESYLFNKSGAAINKVGEKLHLKEPAIVVETQVSAPVLHEETSKHRDLIAQQKIVLAEQSRALH